MRCVRLLQSLFLSFLNCEEMKDWIGTIQKLERIIVYTSSIDTTSNETHTHPRGPIVKLARVP